MAVAVMAPMVLGAAAGMMTTIRASAGAQAEQRLQLGLTNATEAVRETVYEPCTTAERLQSRLPDFAPVDPAPVDLAGGLEPFGTPVHSIGLLEPRVERIAYWNTAAGGFVDRCDTDEGSQLVTVSVSDGDRVATGEIVVRVDRSGSDQARR